MSDGADPVAHLGLRRSGKWKAWIGDVRYDDLFRGRIMFPISDSNGRVIGFTGRVLDPKDNPKYYNTQQLMDVVFTVGQYNLVSMALNTLGVQLDEGLPTFAST